VSQKANFLHLTWFGPIFKRTHSESVSVEVLPAGHPSPKEKFKKQKEKEKKKKKKQVTYFILMSAKNLTSCRWGNNN